ncbi:MAG: putative bifunctional diguanylate cyclase/phosphodiesterase [Acidobacteriota bacterium]
MRNADIAMYAAKRLKQGHSVYDQQRDLHSVRNLTLIGDLRRAVEKDELEMVYQPKMSCLSDAPVGLEALVRWTHPVHGSLPPDEFVGLAERTGLIRPLTRRILEKTLRQAALWRRQHLDYPIAVNLSALNLKEDDLPWTLRQLLDEFDLPAKSILLEITETVIMEDPQRAMNIVSELAFMGVKISIDDFGTGYSSLAYLRKLPAGELKIDRSFVMEMDTDREDTVIVRSIIEMAHNLGLQVVAEGVETEAAWQSLKKLGCDFGQGYFFSRPLPPLEITRWLRTHAAPPSGMDGLSDLDTASRQQAIT